MRHPEFRASEGQVELWKQALLDQGCLLLREVFNPTVLMPLLQRAQQAYARADHQFAAGILGAEAEKMYRYGHTAAADCYPPNNPYYALAERIQASVLAALFRTLWGSELALLYYNSLFRRQKPFGDLTAASQPPLPWHQDAAFLGTQIQVINCWIPLNNCGVVAPGLELAYPAPNSLLRPPALPEGHIPQAGDAYALYALTPNSEAVCWQPHLKRGDVLLFHNLTLHRTALSPEMTETRISLEIRCAEPQAAQALDTFYVPVRLK